VTNLDSTRGVKTIIIVNVISTFVTLIFWVLVLIKIYILQNTDIVIDNVLKASTLGFLAADFFWAIPLLVISIAGLRKLNTLGWLAALMVNILWFYSLTSLWVRDIYLGTISPGDYVFLPFGIFAIWSTYYLWIKKEKFDIS